MTHDPDNCVVHSSPGECAAFQMRHEASNVAYHRILESLTDEQLDWYMGVLAGIARDPDTAAIQAAYHMGLGEGVQWRRESEVPVDDES